MTVHRVLPAVLAAAFAFVSGPAQAEMKNQWVEYSHGNTKLKAYMAYDDKVTGRRPAVLMIHAREGMTPKTQELAETWAKLGYVSFAADIFGYGQGVLPKNVEEMTAQTTIYSKDRALMRARTQAGYDTLVKKPMVDAGKIALVGYCFVKLAQHISHTGSVYALVGVTLGPRAGFFAGWALMGAYIAIGCGSTIEMGLFPLPVVDKVVQELRGAKLPFQLEVYSGTGHGFSTPKNKAEERANTQSIASASRTLKELFGI